MQYCGLNQTGLIEATFLRLRLEFQSYSCIQYTLDTTHPLTHAGTKTHLRAKVMASFQSNTIIFIYIGSTGSRGCKCHNLESLISSHSDIKEGISNSFQDVLENILQLNVWLWFTVFTPRLSPQSGFGHPAITVHENAGSRHQRLFQDYSSQEHEITLWQIQLAWKDTMSLIRSRSVLNQIAYKCPKLNQAAPWNVASWLYWSLTQTGQHFPVLNTSAIRCFWCFSLNPLPTAQYVKDTECEYITGRDAN